MKYHNKDLAQSYEVKKEVLKRQNTLQSNTSRSNNDTKGN